MSTKKPAGAKAPAPTPEEVAEIMRAGINSPDPGMAEHLKRLEAAEVSPVAEHLDFLALKDLVRLEQRVPKGSDDEHAQKVWEYIGWVRGASNSMKANYWLRQAMAHSKDFMLWDDAAQYDRYRETQTERAKQGGKLSHNERSRLANEYQRRVKNGEKYGALKALAAQYNITERQVSNIIKCSTASIKK